MSKWLFQALAYVKYFFKSKKGVKAHSTFVYDLSRLVIYHKADRSFKLKSTAYRKDVLSKNNQVFEKIDLGTGTSRDVVVSALAKSSSIKAKYGELLTRLVRYQSPNNILELGTCLGMSTFYLADGADKLTSIEGCPNTQKIASDLLKTALGQKKSSQLNLIHTDFDSYLESSQSVFDFVFIDGNHSYAPTIKYFNILWAQLPENALIILDDIHWSIEMEKAWNEIIEKTEALISIDLFQIGLCFKKSQQAKEHFVIRY